jgi:hypothetical protein
VTTKLQGIVSVFDRQSFQLTFEVTRELLEAIADDDEQAALYLLELLGELMTELKQVARGEHPLT